MATAARYALALLAPPPVMQDAPVNEEMLELLAAAEGEEIVFDYSSLGLTLRSHPMKVLRPTLRSSMEATLAMSY